MRLNRLASSRRRSFPPPTQEWNSATPCYRLPPMATLCQQSRGLLLSVNVFSCPSQCHYTIALWGSQPWPNTIACLAACRGSHAQRKRLAVTGLIPVQLAIVGDGEVSPLVEPHLPGERKVRWAFNQARSVRLYSEAHDQTSVLTQLDLSLLSQGINAQRGIPIRSEILRLARG